MPSTTSGQNSSDKDDKVLEKSLEDSFPASDPASVTRAPSGKSESTVPPKGSMDRQTPHKDHEP